jgi:RNA polymerase sporulation-specific sigma factor
MKSAAAMSFYGTRDGSDFRVDADRDSSAAGRSELERIRNTPDGSYFMLSEYLRELQHVALLTPSQEAELWRSYRREGVRHSRQRLIVSYQPLVFKVVMGLRPPEAHVMDLIQEGAVGLIEAVERFDPDRGVRFSTFATYRIRGRVLNALGRARVDVSLDQLVAPGDEHSPIVRLADPQAAAMLAGVEDRAAAEHVLALIDEMPFRERTVLRAAAGHQPPRRTARELRVSLSHFYRLQKQAVASLRALLSIEGVHFPRRASGY